MDEFQVGDVVIVKGTCVRMTVNEVSEIRDSIECIWFDLENELHRDTFPRDILKKVSE